MMRFNPDTQQMEDDGQPDPSAIAAPTLNAAPTDTGGGAPAPAAPSPAIAVIAPPEESHKVEQTGPQTTTTVPTAGEQKALTDLETSGKDRLAAEDQKLAAQKPILGAQAKTAERQAAVLQEAERQKAAARQAMAAEVKRLQGEAEKRRQEMEAAAHPTTYWEDKGTPGKVLAALFTGMQAFADGLTGNNRPNPVWEMYQHAEAVDRQQKIDRFKNSEEFHKLAQQDIVAAQHALADKLKAIDDEATVKGNVLAKQLDAVSKRLAIPAAAAATADFKAKLAEDNAEKRAKEQSHLAKKVESGRTTVSDTQNTNKGEAGKPDPLTVPGWNGGVLGRAATQKEADELRKAHAAGHSLGDLVDELKQNVKDNGAVLNPVTQAAAAQRRAQLQTEIAGKLTIANQTGTLQAGEFKRYSDITQPGVMQAMFGKPEQFNATMDQLKADSERGYNRMVRSQGLNPSAVEQPAAAQPAPSRQDAPAKSPKIQTLKKNGKRYYKHNGEWFEL